MSLVPDTQQGKIDFFQSKVAPWTTNMTSIGLVSGDLTSLTAKLSAAQDAVAAAIAADEAKKTATAAANMAIAALAGIGSDCLQAIRAKAATAGDSVYLLAEIPAPATPGPVGKPSLPYQLVATLKPDGSLGMKWKCNNPTGCDRVIYQVYRTIPSTGAKEYLGGSGTKEFVDLTLPAGVPSVIYQIQGVRSTAAGDAANFTVNFGTTSGSGTTGMSVVANAPTPAKIAA